MEVLSTRRLNELWRAYWEVKRWRHRALGVVVSGLDDSGWWMGRRDRQQQHMYDVRHQTFRTSVHEPVHRILTLRSPTKYLPVRDPHTPCTAGHDGGHIMVAHVDGGLVLGNNRTCCARRRHLGVRQGGECTVRINGVRSSREKVLRYRLFHVTSTN